MTPVMVEQAPYSLAAANLLVPEQAEAAFIPTLPGVDINLSAIADPSASIRLENGHLLVAPAFGPVLVLENFVAATAHRPINLLLPGGTTIVSTQLLELLAAPIDFSIADILVLRQAASAPADSYAENTGSPPPEPNPVPVRLLREDDQTLPLADTAPRETVRGLSPLVDEQGSLAGPRPDIAVAPPSSEDTTAGPTTPPAFDGQPPTQQPPPPANQPATPGSLAGTPGDDTVTITGPVAGLSVDLGAGDDTLILASGIPPLIDLGDGNDRLDLSALGPANFANAEIQGVETVELRGGSGTALALTAQDVLDLSPGTDTLFIEGDSADVVTIGAGWSTAPGALPSGEAATIYTQTLGDRTATLIAASDVSVA